jgi:probable HAF family extracellular repeat protein
LFGYILDAGQDSKTEILGQGGQTMQRSAILALMTFVMFFGIGTTALADSYGFATIDDPSAISGTTHAFGINSSGQMVGTFADGTGTHGFLDTAGIFTTIDNPGAISTFPLGINSSGQIVGYFADGTGLHGFLDTAGTFTTIDDPSATIFGTEASGINDSGQIVGVFFDASGQHGFLATPTSVPEPGTLTFLCTVLIGLAALQPHLAAYSRMVRFCKGRVIYPRRLLNCYFPGGRVMRSPDRRECP